MRNNKLLALAALLCLPAVASADPCAGDAPFTDIPAGEIFCTNTEWLANRSITLGCTATTFCPDLAVTRAQMALFMNRLGVALTPVAVVSEQAFSAIDLDTPTFRCATDVYAIDDYPRQIALTGHFSGLTTDAASYSVGIYYNTTGSDSDFPNAANTVAGQTGTPGASWTHVTTSATLPLEVGTTYRFALRVTRESGTGDLSNTRCHLTQILMNRNGTTPPFDAPAR